MYKDSLIILAIILVSMMLVSVFGGCVSCEAKNVMKKEGMGTMMPLTYQPSPDALVAQPEDMGLKNMMKVGPDMKMMTTQGVPNAYDDALTYAAVDAPSQPFPLS